MFYSSFETTTAVAGRTSDKRSQKQTVITRTTRVQLKITDSLCSTHALPVTQAKHINIVEAELCGFDARCALVAHAVTSAPVAAIAAITAEAVCEAAMKREVQNVNRGSRCVVSGEVSAQVRVQRAGLSSRAASSDLSRVVDIECSKAPP